MLIGANKLTKVPWTNRVSKDEYLLCRSRAKVSPNSDYIFRRGSVGGRKRWPVAAAAAAAAAAVALHWRSRVGAVGRLTPPPPSASEAGKARERTSERSGEGRQSLHSLSISGGQEGERQSERKRAGFLHVTPPPHLEWRLAKNKFDRTTKCSLLTDSKKFESV